MKSLGQSTGSTLVNKNLSPSGNTVRYSTDRIQQFARHVEPTNILLYKETHNFRGDVTNTLAAENALATSCTVKHTGVIRARSDIYRPR